MAIYSIIDCAEKHASISESMQAAQGIAAQVTLNCAWADRFLLMADLLSNMRVWPNGGFTIPPKAQACSCIPVPGAYIQVGQACVYELAEVTVNYSHKIVDVFSETLEPTAEFITADHKQFAWVDEVIPAEEEGGEDTFTGPVLLEGEAPGFLLRSCNLVRTLYNIPTLPSDILTLVGMSNDDDYTSALLGITFPTETLMFCPPQPSRTFNSVGTEGWTLQMKFACKPNGWNKFWRPAANGGNGGWDQIYHIESKGLYKPHPPADFAAYLF